MLSTPGWAAACALDPAERRGGDDTVLKKLAYTAGWDATLGMLGVGPATD